ncbi:MAG: cysteine-rich CWC family protein [Pseudopedobacter sp.]|nr:cysteine-rich CWC family protein [Deinococcales bacterium]
MLLEPESEILKVLSGSCPFCGESNACAVNASKGQPVLECWCFRRTFPKELLEQVPLESRGCACVCAACPERFVVETE